jgi:hypothetical protein
MTLENKLNITSEVELAKAEEKISKQKAKQGNFCFAPLMYLKASLEHRM